MPRIRGKWRGVRETLINSFIKYPPSIQRFPNHSICTFTCISPRNAQRRSSFPMRISAIRRSHAVTYMCGGACNVSMWVHLIDWRWGWTPEKDTVMKKRRPRAGSTFISARVPWKDNGYNGFACNKPYYNNACLRLETIVSIRGLRAGKWIERLPNQRTWSGDALPFVRQMIHVFGTVCEGYPSI